MTNHERSQSAFVFENSFVIRHSCFVLKISPPGNYGKEDQTTVAAFLPWRGLPVLNP